MRRGFTPIKLLVVIGILLAILLPAVSKSRQQALGAKCAFNMRQSAFTWIMFVETIR